MNITKRIKTSKSHLAVIGVIVVLAALLLTAGVASAQPVADLDLTFGGGEDDFAHAVIQTIDGGYVIAGETQSFGAGGRDFWLIKTDASGNQLWTSTFGGPADDVAYALAQTSDGGLVVAGSSAQDAGSKTDFLLIKTDSSGNQQWSQRYANPNGGSDDVAYAVRQTADGGYIIAGSTDGPDGQNVWLVKTNAGGDRVWEKEFGNGGSETAFSVQQTADGGYVITGYTNSYGAGVDDVGVEDILDHGCAGSAQRTNHGIAVGIILEDRQLHAHPYPSQTRASPAKRRWPRLRPCLV